MIDLLLPFLRRFFSGIDVFDIIALAVFDDVGDPAALDFDGCRAVGEEGRALRAVEVELGRCQKGGHQRRRGGRDGVLR